MKTKLLRIFDYVSIMLFGLTFFSVPALSFIKSLYKITWVLTILFLISVCCIFIIKNSFKFNTISCALVLFMISAVISTLINKTKPFNFTPILMTAFTFIVYSYLLDDKSKVPLFLFASYFANCLFLAYFIFAYRSDLIHLNFTRLGNLFGDQNDISLFMAYGAIFSLYIILSKYKLWQRLVAILPLLLFTICGLTTGSKMFILVVAGVGCFSIFVCLKQKWFIKLAIVLSLIGTLVLFINLPFMDFLKKRIAAFLSALFRKSIDGQNGDVSTYERLNMFYCGIQMFLKKPVFGYGIWGFATYSNYNSGWSHNQISETLCNYGMIGFILFHFPFAVSIYNYFKNPKNMTRNLCILILTMFLISLFSISFDTEKIFAYLVGILYAYLSTDDGLFELKIAKRKNSKLFRIELI